MTRRRASLALAAIVVVARLVGSGGATTAAAATSEETIRAVPAHPHAPSRAVRSAQSVHARVVTRGTSLTVCLATVPLVFEAPPQTLVAPAVRPPAPPVTGSLPPVSLARAPPR